MTEQHWNFALMIGGVWLIALLIGLAVYVILAAVGVARYTTKGAFFILSESAKNPALVIIMIVCWVSIPVLMGIVSTVVGVMRSVAEDDKKYEEQRAARYKENGEQDPLLSDWQIARDERIKREHEELYKEPLSEFEKKRGF